MTYDELADYCKYASNEIIRQDEQIRKLEKENEELKKQLEEMDRKLFFAKNELDMRQKSIDNKLNQQQEFIKYLEKEIVDCKAGSGQQYYAQEHLKMFKETIGVSND